jgi:hypothetical protein
MHKSRPIYTPLPKGTIVQCNSGALLTDATFCRAIVGKLLYLTRTPHDLAFAVSIASRYI